MNHAVDSQVAHRKFIMSILRGIVFVASVIILTFAGLVGLELFKVPDLAFLENYQPAGHLQIFDRENKLVCNIEGVEKRHLIPLSQINPYLQRAVLSAEDHHYYQHHGIDAIGIFRAILANVAAGHPVQGGSTITQQLAKNLFFEEEKRSIQLKVAESIVASQLESRFSKEKILELYLNEVYFGNGAYGIEQAARLYFDKPASQLTIGESAFIAGVIRSPSKGGMIEYRNETLARQQEVIDKMFEYGFISMEQCIQAKNQVLEFKAPAAVPKVNVQIPKYPYYLSYVLEQVREMFTEGEMQRHGLKIYTNLDQAAQQAAERALAQGLRSAPRGCNQGALVSLNVKDGAVVALVGGVGNYLDNQWNCATNPHTIGSAFKPFVYLAGFCHGTMEPESIIEDLPLQVRTKTGEEYKPKNFDGKFMGPISIAEAVAYSRNVPAVRAAQRVGIDSVIRTAKLAGINARLDPHLSLALGCAAISPLEMAGAYGTLARGGERIDPWLIRRVENKHGFILKAPGHASQRVFDTEPVAKMVDVLQQVVVQGTGTQAKLTDRPVAGKTGTADQAKDLWFVGFTPDLVTAVWGGNEDNKPIPGSHVTGGTVMARIWRDYNKAYYLSHNVPTGGWFIACTRLIGDFAPRKAESARSVAKAQAAAARRTNVRPVKYYADNDFTVYTQPHPSRGAAYKQPSGVTEYRWRR
jgi:penicillin-binding protein 1A